MGAGGADPSGVGGDIHRTGTRAAIKRQLIAGALCLLLYLAEDIGPSPSVWAQPAAVTERSYEILEVYLSVEEALKLMFPKASRFEAAQVRLNEEQRARVAALADHPLWEEQFTVHRAMAGDRLEGYAIMAEEIGRFHFITCMVGVAPDGTIKQVEVLVYRESRGGEVRHRRFLHQYEGKSLANPIRHNRDILNITGATLSVRAMNRGVRKALGAIKEAYGIP